MGLADRLASLGYRASLEKAAAPQKSPLELAVRLRARWEETAYGPALVRTFQLGQGPLWGGSTAPELQATDWLLFNDAGGTGLPDLARTIFLDTETTGLMGGTGTYAFLVGVGYLREGSFRVRQFFMADYGHERATLTALLRELSQFDTLVTFNGRSFDWPLLQTRFLMHRDLELPRFSQHIDLLTYARRLWRQRLCDCSLRNLEAKVLGVEREGDIPGWLIPDAYFRFLRTGDPAEMAAVMHHNQLDVEAMISLLWRMTASFRAAPGEIDDCDDLCSLARIHERRRDWQRAVGYYEAAVASSRTIRERNAIQTRLGFAYKRAAQRQQAAGVWSHLARGTDHSGVTAAIELAKHQEHVLRDYVAAIETVRRALQLLASGANPAASPAVLRLELVKRLGRLEAKQRRHGDSTIAVEDSLITELRRQTLINRRTSQ